MSDKIKPNIVLIPNPVGLDLALQELQIALSSVLEFKYIFGRARKNKLREGSKIHVIPEVYRSKEKYINVLPNREYANYCFFVVSDPLRFLEYESNQNEYLRQANVSLICWFTLSKIDISKDYIFTEEIKESIYDVLNKRTEVNLVREFEDLENVFREFTLEEIETKYFKYPYYGIRIELELNYLNGCKNG